jgi:hypothetical protein
MLEEDEEENGVVELMSGTCLKPRETKLESNLARTLTLKSLNCFS